MSLKQGNLPEEVATPQRRDIHSVTYHPGCPPLDEKEVFSRLPLNADSSTRADRLFLDGPRQVLQLGRAKGGENGCRPQQVEVVGRYSGSAGAPNFGVLTRLSGK